MSALVNTISVSLGDLNLPENWRRNLDRKNVADLAEQLRGGRTLPPIKVDRETRRVVAGYHRVAAHIAAGADVIRADVIEYADRDDAELDSIAENLHRRHLTPEQRDDLRDRYAAILARRAPKDVVQVHDDTDDRDGISGHDVQKSENRVTDDRDGISGHDVQEFEEPRPGRKRARDKAVRQKTAADLGVSERTIRRAQNRVAERAGTKPPSTKGRDADPAIDLHGIEIDIKDADAINEVKHQLTAIASGAKDLLAKVTRFETWLGKDHKAMCDRLSPHCISELRRLIGEAGRIARGWIPTDVCMYCKNVAAERPKCGACAGTLFLTADQADNVPDELRVEGDGAGIYVKGKFRKLVDLKR